MVKKFTRVQLWPLELIPMPGHCATPPCPRFPIGRVGLSRWSSSSSRFRIPALREKVDFSPSQGGPQRREDFYLFCFIVYTCDIATLFSILTNLILTTFCLFLAFLVWPIFSLGDRIKVRTGDQALLGGLEDWSWAPL